MEAVLRRGCCAANQQRLIADVGFNPDETDHENDLVAVAAICASYPL